MKLVFQRLWDALKTDWPRKILALVFALLIWSYVIAETNPMRELTVSNVPLNVIGASEIEAKYLTPTGGLSAMNIPVTVTVSAGQNQHKLISANNVKATVDLTSINSKGEVTLKITPSSTYGTAVSVSPSSITLNIEELIERDLPVKASLVGEPQSGYFALEPELSPQTVTVRGAKSVLERAAEAVCYIETTGLSSSFRQTRTVSLLDSDGATIESDGFIGLPSVIASVEIYTKKYVSVDEEQVLEKIKNVAKGYEISSVTVSPHVVEIAVPNESAGETHALELEAIDLAGASSSTLLSVRIKETQDVIFVNSPLVDVYVQIDEQKETRTFRNQSIKIRNAPSGAQATPKTTDITITGPASIVQDLKASDLVAFIDAGNPGAGTYQLPVRLESIEGLSESSVTFSNSAVTLVVKK